MPLPRALTEHPLFASTDFRNLFVGDVLVTIAERYFVLTFTWWMLLAAVASRR